MKQFTPWVFLIKIKPFHYLFNPVLELGKGEGRCPCVGVGEVVWSENSLAQRLPPPPPHVFWILIEIVESEGAKTRGLKY